LKDDPANALLAQISEAERQQAADHGCGSVQCGWTRRDIHEINSGSFQCVGDFLLKILIRKHIGSPSGLFNPGSARLIASGGSEGSSLCRHR